MMLARIVGEERLQRRYMVVEYAQGRRGILFDERGCFKNHLPIHHLLHGYHWSHLDVSHVLVVGHIAPHHARIIETRDDVSMLPLVHSPQPIRDAMKKPAHWEAFRHYHAAGLADTFGATVTMRDVIDGFVQKHGPVFAPPY